MQEKKDLDNQRLTISIAFIASTLALFQFKKEIVGSPVGVAFFVVSLLFFVYLILRSTDLLYNKKEKTFIFIDAKDLYPWVFDLAINLFSVLALGVIIFSILNLENVILFFKISNTLLEGWLIFFSIILTGGVFFSVLRMLKRLFLDIKYLLLKIKNKY